jgi:hypothetical protein
MLSSMDDPSIDKDFKEKFKAELYHKRGKKLKGSKVKISFGHGHTA